MSSQFQEVETISAAEPAEIPMRSQVYVQVRNRLRKLETLIREQPPVLRGDGDVPTDRGATAVLEAQAATLRAVAERALVVPIGERAIVGSIVAVRSAEDAPLEQYEIVIPTEADPLQRKVSFDSPIGRALMGLTVGDTAIVETPRGRREVTVAAIRHE